MNGPIPEAPPEFEEKTPPFSAEAEISVIGGALIDSEAVALAIEGLRAEDFYRLRHRKVFEAIEDLYREGVEVDVVTAVERLKAKGDLEDAGGHRFLAELLDAVPSAANVEYHIGIVRDRSMLRSLIDASNASLRDAFESAGRPAAEVVERAESRILRIADSSTTGDFALIKTALWPTFEKIEEWHKRPGEPSGLETGFPTLDRMTSGFQAGDLIVLAARPSMGKTALALSIIEKACIEGGKSIAIESLEMSREMLALRLLSSGAGVDLQKIKMGESTAEEQNRLATTSSRLNTAPLFVDDRLDVRVSALRSRIRRLARTEDLALVVVDYLQLLEGEGDSRTQQVSMISRTLKQMAVETSVPVLVLSQLSRGPENRPDKRPQLSDLRESGAIEQDADVVMFLYRPEYYMTTADAAEADVRGVAEVIFGKQRNGPTGIRTLHFDASTTKFREVARGRDEERAAALAPDLPFQN